MRLVSRFSSALWLSGFLSVVALWSGCAPSVPQEATPAGSATASADHDAPAAAGAPAPAAGLKRIIILVNNASSFWDAARAGVLDANRELNLEAAGYVASLEVPEGTIQGQLDRLRQIGSQSDIAALGISPLESDNAALADELQKLKDQGIPLITFDSDLDRTKYRDLRTAFLGTNNYAAGVVLGQCAKALRPEGGAYATFVGRTGAQNAMERIDGFGQGAGPTFVAKDKLADDGDRSRAAENTRNAIRNHPDLNVLVGIWSYNAPAIVDVVREQQLRSKFTIPVFDAEALTITAMEQGDVDCMVVQDPYAMGYQSVKALHAMLTKNDAVLKEMLPNLGQPEGDIFDTGLKVVVPNAETPIKPEVFQSKVQFMLLPAFQEWMAKYGLTST
jgi:ribose transport system substrate-binding protein